MLCSDSVILSTQQVNHHFLTSKAFPYLAARYGNAKASKFLYQQSNEVRWLKLAAKQGDVEAAFDWYLLSPEQRKVWLDFAVRHNNHEAILEQLALFVKAKEWPQAQSFSKRYNAQQQTNWSRIAQEKFQQLVHLTEVALTPPELFESPVNLVSSQPQLNPNCKMQVQVFVAATALLNNAKRFEQSLSDNGLGSLPICFNQPTVVAEVSSVCNRDRLGRLECDIKKLAVLTENQVSQNGFTHLIVVLEQGEANTRGGLMFLDKNDNEQVFVHELSHWLGFVDEYQIGRQQQQELCKTDNFSTLGLNLFITNKNMSKEQAQKAAGRQLYPAKTCEGSQVTAYKYFETASFMEYLQQPISDTYRQLLLSKLKWGRVVPVSMNFASAYHLYPQQYLRYINQAADHGYHGAMERLAQSYIDKGKYLQALNWLEKGAEQGNANSQLMLGHAYIEGAWIPRDLKLSARFYKQAADQNDGYGLYFYAKCLEMGWGCIQSQQLAHDYYQRSAQLGNPLALQKVKRL